MRAMKRNNEKLIAGFSPTVYISKLVNCLAFLSITVCSVYYSWRLTRKSNGFWIKICRVQQVSPAITSTAATTT
ncbi:hypothetical protein DdX_22171 [Ditylenchus destructor]|uniref:Uncharacterized protein n=1 Tax=Ditylenchus destructor TaxID=166010 RepID=A0AAD4MG57_9BILA|nr:hypothetical protein DdX_22171 [Ditylenchus destructor]